VLTNSPVYAQHLENWNAKKPKNNEEYSGDFSLSGNVSSDQRFMWNKYMREQLKEPSSYRNGLAKIESSTYKVPLDAANKNINGVMTGYGTQYTLIYNLDKLEMNVRYQHGDVYTQFSVDFNQLNDGKNYTIKAEQQSNVGDITDKLIEKNGMMEQYRH
jgi:choloylglycine hydrolase